MRTVLDPFRFMLIAVLGWMNQHQLQVIDQGAYGCGMYFVIRSFVIQFLKKEAPDMATQLATIRNGTEAEIRKVGAALRLHEQYPSVHRCSGNNCLNQSTQSSSASLAPALKPAFWRALDQNLDRTTSSGMKLPVHDV